MQAMLHFLNKNVKLVYIKLKKQISMRYTDKEGNTLNLDEVRGSPVVARRGLSDQAMTADSFLMVADVYIREPLEMYFNAIGELRAGKRPKGAVAIPSNS